MKPALLPWFALLLGLVVIGVIANKYVESKNPKPKQLDNE
jgi:hypothetical protein